MAGPATPHQDDKRDKAAFGWLVTALPLLLAGLAMVIVGDGYGWDGVGSLLILVAIVHGIIASGLFGATRIARRSERRRPFA